MTLPEGAPIRVLHVAASDQRRGAEVFAADLIGHTLDAADHRLMYLRRSTGARVDYPCEARVVRGGRVGNGRVFGVASAAYEVRRAMREFRPHVVLAHGGESLRVSIAASPGARVPIVYRRIGMAPDAMRRGLRRQWHRMLIGRADRVVCVAAAVRHELLDRFKIPARRVVVVPNGVDPARLAGIEVEPSVARARVGVPGDASVILSLGALSWEKDPIGMLEVSEPLLRAEARLRHVFAGDGPLRTQLEGRVRELGLAGRVIVLGAYDDIGVLFAASDVFLSRSRVGGMEGMPAAMIEAGLAGRAVVAASVPGVPEVVVDGVTGLLAEPSDVDGLREALRGLLADPQRRQALGDAARRRCCERFAIGVVARAYVAVWDSLVS